MNKSLAKVLEFPVKKEIKTKVKTTKSVKLPRLFSLVMKDNRLNEVGISEGDEIIVDTMQAVENGDLILIESNQCYVCGFALFLGDGKLRLTYYNDKYEAKTYILSSSKIIGKVLHSSKDWKNFRLAGGK